MTISTMDATPTPEPTNPSSAEVLEQGSMIGEAAEQLSSGPPRSGEPGSPQEPVSAAVPDSRDAASGMTGDGEADAPAGPPERYEITPPQGGALDAGMLAAVEPVFRDLGLDNSQAQQLTDAYARDVLPRLVQQVGAQAQQQLLGDVVKTRRQWAESFAADPEIGGTDEERGRKLSVMARAIDAFGGPDRGRELRQLLNDTGLGNSPVIGRLLYRVGQRLAEAEVHHSDGAALARRSTAEKFYGQAFGPQPPT